MNLWSLNVDTHTPVFGPGQNSVTCVEKPVCGKLACLILLCSAFIYFKLKVCGNPTSSKSFSTIFPLAFVHLVSLSHVLVTLEVVQTFSLLCLWCDL